MQILKRFDVRLILALALFMLVTLVSITSLIVHQYHAALMNQSEAETLKSFEHAEMKIDRLLQTARKSAAMLLKKDEVADYLYKSFDKASQRVTALVNLFKRIGDTLSYGESLNGLWLFHEDGTMVGATKTWNFAFEKEPHPMFYAARLEQLAKWDSITWLGGWWLEDFTQYPPQGGSASAAKTGGDVLILGVLRCPYRLWENNSVRTIYELFSVDVEPLQECFETLDSDGELFLLDEKGRQMVGPALEQLRNEPWFYASLDTAARNGSMKLEHLGESYQLVHHRIQSTGWTLVKKIPYDIYAHQVRQLRAKTWAIGLGVLLTAITLLSLWIICFVRPFKEMSAALERVRHGDLSVQLRRPSGVYEFELMRGEFNSMIQSIRQLLSQTKDMEHERIELELRNLQSQLNPHMVFNSITAIRWMAMMSGADKVGDMLVELAELIRPIFTEWRLVWSLRDEMTYVSHYVKLLTLRYGGLIITDVFIDESLMDVCLPCFTLQPLMENSAEHGVREGKPLTLTVEGERMEDGRIRLCVKDNGRGMPSEKLAVLRRNMDAKDVCPDTGAGRSGVGLINICRRLRMFGGENSGMTIESTENEGTVITLWLPGTAKTEE